MPILRSSSDPIRVQPFTGYRNASHLRLSARALIGHAPEFSKSGWLGTMRTMAALYASHEVAGLEIALILPDGSRHSARSDAEGFVQFHVPIAPVESKGAVWEKARLEWSAEGKNGAVDARILAPSPDSQLGIISDIDDTIIETGITGGIRAITRNAHRIFAQSPAERKVVPGAPQFFQALTSSKGAAPNPLFYISSSPWNLYPYLRYFKQLRELPDGPLLLRDWGLNRRTLGASSHGAHKRDAIRQVFGDFPHMRFALVGDDTQGDLAAFAQTAEAYGDRVAGVFVRRAATTQSPDEEAARETFKAHGVRFWIGEDFTSAHSILDHIQAP